MPLSQYQQHVTSRPALTLTVALLAFSITANLTTPVRHSLLTRALAWLITCIYATWATGTKSLWDGSRPEKLGWTAGALLALVAVQERTVNGSGIWWAKALIPLLLYTLQECGLVGNGDVSPPEEHPDSPIKPGTPPGQTSGKTLIILTASAVATVYVSTGSSSVLALGLSYAVLNAAALVLVQQAGSEARHQSQNGGSLIYSANGFLSQPDKLELQSQDTFLTVLRNVSTAAAVCLAASVFALEPMSFSSSTYWSVKQQPLEDHHAAGFAMLSVLYAVIVVAVNIAMEGVLILMIQRYTVYLPSFVPLAAAIFSTLIVHPSLGRFWFAILAIFSTLLLFNAQNLITTDARLIARGGRLLTILAVASFAGLALFYVNPSLAQNLSKETWSRSNRLNLRDPSQPFGPLQPASTRMHPINQLVEDARTSWTATLKSQSSSLEAATAAYKRRYGLPPPPHFDKWYEFATLRSVQLIDDYDAIYHSLLPFWAVAPATIRARVREALGFDNNLMAVVVRSGRVVHVEGGPDWLREAIIGMMDQFVQHLPDMDLAFNVHDEPRVVVPHDELSHLVKVALNSSLPAASTNPAPKNAFSPRPEDVKLNKHIEEVKTTRFNVFAHQSTWIPSRLSCAPDSPARGQDEFYAVDNLTTYALSELGLIYNHTAFTDVCNSPSFSSSHGFFDRPNAFNVIHDLFPIFSQSKMSSFQDILYPSPWYWYGKVEYDEKKDMDWQSKISALWWRGSTTGGFSRNGGWRRQHRQQLVRKLNALDTAQIYTNVATDASAPADWQTKSVQRQSYAEALDVHFSHVGQCDPGDCDAQREFFKVVPPADQQEAWKFRYLLDMDGNAFSGRFYAFLQSHSLTFKMNVFREWHEEWIKPWVHYVPLSLRADEGLEAVRYFKEEAEGQAHAVRMAEESRTWAKKALRKEDVEAWFFRLLLEYGRVVDDNRETIGYPGF